MEYKSIHVVIPSAKPFDRTDWFECFVGHFVRPVVESGLIESFWFSRYEDKTGRHARFRVRLANYAALKPQVDEALVKFGFKEVGDELDYDAGEFRSPRFLGDNPRQRDEHARQELVWKFLHASAQLYLDTFSHVDADGYWHREENKDKGNNIDGDSMESPHHLFCNMTDLSPRVDLMALSNSGGAPMLKLFSGHYRKWMGLPDTGVCHSERVRF